MAGGLEADDSMVVEQLQEANRRVQHANNELAALHGRSKHGATAALTSERLGHIASAIRKALHEGDPQFRRAYLRLFVNQVVVGDRTIHISGPSRALLAAANDETADKILPRSSHFHGDWRRKGNRHRTVSGGRNIRRYLSSALSAPSP